MSKEKFDYEEKLWGASKVRLSPTYLGALRLKYSLEDLKEVKGKILEMGCGGGGMAKAIKFYRPDLEVYGCDISRKAIEIAKKEGSGVKFLVGDAYDLPFEDNFFEALVSFDLLEHLEYPKKALREAYRVLRPGGIFSLFVPCEGSPFTLPGILVKLGWQAKEKYGGHIQRFTKKQLMAILETAGLSVANTRWGGHFFNQLVDTLYFSWLSLRGRNVSYSVESYLEKTKPSPFRQGVWVLKVLVALVSYGESSLLSWLPGGGVHLNCVKERVK